MADNVLVLIPCGNYPESVSDSSPARPASLRSYPHHESIFRGSGPDEESTGNDRRPFGLGRRSRTFVASVHVYYDMRVRKEV